MNADKIISIASKAGKIILENGGETYRVEETISMICLNLGLKDIESFVTPTGIIVSCIDSNGRTCSLVKRVKSRGVNLEKISLVNELSRNISNKSFSCNEIEKLLADIDSKVCYNLLQLCVAASISTLFFTLLFGGSIKDGAVAFVTGTLIKLCSYYLSKNKLNDFFVNIIGGMIAAIIALASVYLSLGDNYNTIIIGSIMLLVPGLAITNAVRDTMAGDLLAALSRALEAFLTAVAIAIGT